MKMSLLIIDEMIIDQTSCADKGLVKKYGGGGVGRRREGVGHGGLSLVQGVGRAICSYP